MNKPRNEISDVEMDALFDATRADPPRVPDALMARVIVDARMVQPRGLRVRGRGWLRQIGGLPGLGGMVAATCVGFWLGVAAPEGLPDLTIQVWDEAENAALEIDTDLTGFGWDIEEIIADG